MGKASSRWRTISRRNNMDLISASIIGFSGTVIVLLLVYAAWLFKKITGKHVPKEV